MRTGSIRQNQLAAEAFAWLQAKYQAVDAMDADAYGRFLAEDCHMRFANNPVSNGRAQILSSIRAFWQNIAGLDHAFQHILGSNYHMAAEALIDYTLKDGRVVTIPCVTLIERNEAGLASSVKIFMDAAPLFNH